MNFCILHGDEILQLFDPVHGFFSMVIVDCGLHLHFLQANHLVSDGIVVFAALDLSKQFFFVNPQASVECLPVRECRL